MADNLQAARRTDQAIRDGKGISVSDGSFCPERLRGTAALRIWHEDTMEKFEAVNRSPGSKEEQNSYRSELCGVAGIIVTATAVCDHYQIDKGKLKIGLDGQQAIDT